MPLAPGDRLGIFEVRALIGKGGMGEVYKARDTKLQRDVALKVLAPAFVHDAERLARFQREAHVLASLNHPHIATLFGLEDSGRTHALVMEFVEGPTLGDRIAQGPIPWEEARPIALQLVEAMEYAHEKNVVHRDIKPANIKVSEDGFVKVLDFGLAKALADDPQPGSDPRNSPTLTLTMATTAGTILGTAPYMSPEQAKGKPVDRRADVWAFGVVLYEMLTAKQLFTGEGPGEILASVIKETVSLDGIPASTPRAIRKLIERCIEKEPKRRLQAIGEARIVMEDAVAVEPPEETPPFGRGSESAPPRPWAWISTAAAALVAVAVLGFVHFREPALPPLQSVRFLLPPPGASAVQNFKLSPDGRTLAFIASDSGTDRVWLRSLDSLDAHAIPGTDGATYPFWSPDSGNIGFFAQGKLKRMAAAGGPAQTICDAPDSRGASWGSAGMIVLAPGVNSGLFKVSATGGVAEAMPKYVPSGVASLRFPAFLPGSDRFLYVVSGNAETSGIFSGSLDGMAPVRLQRDVSQTAFIPSAGGGNGTLLFRRESTLMAQPFDTEHMRMVGEAFPIASQIGEAGNTGFAAFSAAATSQTTSPGSAVLVYQSGSSTAARELGWRDRAGKRLATVANPGRVSVQFGFALSPDGKRVAFSVLSALDTADLWLKELDRDAATRFTFGGGVGERTFPLWSPDGSRVAYSFLAVAHVSDDLFVKPAGGAAKEELLLHGGTNAFLSDWSRDGKFLAYTQTGDTTKNDLWLLPMEGDHKPALYLQTPSNEGEGQFSPDGKFMAYGSDESGQYQVYVQPIPTNGAKWQISTSGGTQPRWRHDGRELFYVAADGKLMAVAIASGDAFAAGPPQMLFERIDADPSQPTFFFQPSADGQRFLVNSPAAGAAGQATPLTVVLNWQAGLKK